jgi:cold shock CspA family protein
VETEPVAFETRAAAEMFCREREASNPGSQWVSWEEMGGRFYAIERDPALDIRRVELRDDGKRRTGTVRWWNEPKGYGRITADDGEILFVLFSDIAGEGYRRLDDGARVSFLTSMHIGDHNRSVATDVRPEGK